MHSRCPVRRSDKTIAVFANNRPGFLRSECAKDAMSRRANHLVVDMVGERSSDEQTITLSLDTSAQYS